MGCLEVEGSQGLDVDVSVKVSRKAGIFEGHLLVEKRKTDSGMTHVVGRDVIAIVVIIVVHTGNGSRKNASWSASRTSLENVQNNE